MKKICEDAFYGLNYIGLREKIEVSKMLTAKSLFRYDGVRMMYESDIVEDQLKKMFKQDLLLVNNGTSALKLCLIANNIGYGDEVIVPCLSFIATAACCLSVGAIPVFTDIDETFNIDPKKIEKHISEKTKAVIIVHYQGYPCNMDEIIKVCKKYDLKLIEDCAQSFGSKYKGKLTGTFGESAAFSFQSCKVITCGEGGAVTSKVNMKDVMRYADNGGERKKDEMPLWNKEYISFGENFKITDLQSAILKIQLKRLDKIVNKQSKIYNKITDGLDYYKYRKILDDTENINMSLCIIFDTDKECDDFIKYMNKRDIPFSKRIGNFLPDYNTFKKVLSPYKNNYPYNKYKVNKCYQSYKLINRSAWLVLNSKMTNSQIKYIRNNMVNYYDK